MADRPFAVHRASTRFLRVPTRYWIEVQSGRRHEFRLSDSQATRPGSLKAPTLIVGWRQIAGEVESMLLVLESIWRERLGEISQASLQAEGFVGPLAFRQFKREWSERTHRRFDALRPVWVVRLRPLGTSLAGGHEFTELAFIHLARLYDEHLPAELRQQATEWANQYDNRDLQPG